MKLRSTFFYVFFLVILTLLSEFVIRKSEKFATHSEKNGIHHNPFVITEPLTEPWLMVYPKDTRKVLSKPEYEDVAVTNSEGMVGTLPPLNKERNEYRIVAIGDSSTVGSGDEEGLGFVGRLAKKYSKNPGSLKYTFINAGVSGSDPIFGLELLKRRLLKYQPDFVLFLVNRLDINDIKRRGGIDRFKEDGQLKDVLPAWMPVFNISHLVRAVVLQVLNYNWQLKPRSLEAQEAKNVINSLLGTFKAALQLGAEKKFGVLVLLEPTAVEVVKKRMPRFFSNIEKDLSNNQVDVANLLPSFLKKIPEQKVKEYFWPIDGHFNSKGYEVFFEAVESELKKRGI